ncbi:MAG: hypothetical protein KAU27_05785 [Desulfuromonadales bacterium]|nr:hypothetical protein [Desulfuromonadales bacterium]
MNILVVLKNGNERSVCQTELQLLINQERILFFERSDGWVVIGRDRLREKKPSRLGKNQQERRAFNKSLWY